MLYVHNVQFLFSGWMTNTLVTNYSARNADTSIPVPLHIFALYLTDEELGVTQGRNSQQTNPRPNTEKESHYGYMDDDVGKSVFC